jgi:NitT/TauT family transport system permease protein
MNNTMIKRKLFNGKSLYGTFMIFVFWYILHILLQSAVIPNPVETVLNFIKIFPGTLLPHMLASLGRIVVAVLFSLLVGLPLGLWTGMSDRADRLITPIVYILYPIPKIAFLPVLMILFGLGNTPKIVLIAIIVIFQIIVTTRDGVKELGKEYFYSAKSLGMNRRQLYEHLIIPAVMPKIITALRLTVGTSIAVLFFSENFAARYGIGYFIMNCWVVVNYVEMFSGILALSMMGLLLFKVIDGVEDRLCAWMKAGKHIT